MHNPFRDRGRRAQGGPAHGFAGLGRLDPDTALIDHHFESDFTRDNQMRERGFIALSRNK